MMMVTQFCLVIQNGDFFSHLNFWKGFLWRLVHARGFLAFFFLFSPSSCMIGNSSSVSIWACLIAMFIRLLPLLLFTNYFVLRISWLKNCSWSANMELSSFEENKDNWYFYSYTIVCYKAYILDLIPKSNGCLFVPFFVGGLIGQVGVIGLSSSITEIPIGVNTQWLDIDGHCWQTHQAICPLSHFFFLVYLNSNYGYQICLKNFGNVLKINYSLSKAYVLI